MRWVILERDGVINESADEPVKSPAAWTPIAGSLEAIAQLNRAGFQVAVLTNQSGLGRGLFDLAALEAIHDHMRAELAAYGCSCLLCAPLGCMLACYQAA